MYKMFVMILVLVMVSSSVNHVYAAQLDAAIAKDSQEFTPTYQFTRIITINHDGDSELEQLIENDKIFFDINKDNTAIVSQINSEIRQKSFAKVTDVTGTYSAIISVQEKSIGIEYRIILKPTIQNHFVGDFDTLDSQWRGFSIDDAIPVDTIHGVYDINSPASALALSNVKALEYLSGTGAMEVLQTPLIDAAGISQFPLHRWESMFDPTAKMSETADFGFSGTVITNYSMGICTVYLGLCEDKEMYLEFTIDGEDYSIRSIESQDDATIVIEGYVSESKLGQVEIFAIQDAPMIDPENDMQAVTLYGMAGLGVAATVAFFVVSDRKAKRTSSEQTGIDPANLQSVPISSSAGGYRTNRGTSQLKN
ncbi:hypothetical protein [Nitrosopumilus sp.]|uniref:hypothetical protein n=1 Tax=Nitrosopumilus sp. TaxID=2024843 RepID=UPI00247BF56F|nr:hypothetical protein [Nitrosopumilus sp.]MCV0431236.1 hypothetical protein [Nitrosopumilus sp.]